MERPADPRLAGALFGGDPARALALLRAAWASAVGADLARRTEVLALQGGTLRVRVPDARWRKVLHRMRGQILARLRAVAGRLAPTSVVFVEEPVASSTSAATDDARSSDATKDTTGVLPVIAEAAAAITDPEIRRRFAESVSRYLSRHA